ncbi:hypothetical protein Landi51_02024 [Colletotrichum acutatum]
MVIGLLAIAAIPTVIGTGQAVSAQKKQNAAAKEQAKFSLTATMTLDGKQEECPSHTQRASHSRPLPSRSPIDPPSRVCRHLHALSLFLAFLFSPLPYAEVGTPTRPTSPRVLTYTSFLANLKNFATHLSWTNAHILPSQIWISHSLAPAPGHKFSGYYFNYPSEPPMRALVSTIAEDPPMLNWIYVDADSRALRHGGRKDTLGHVIGPWGWTDDERHLTLRGSGLGFVAVLEEDGRWAAYWDPDGRLREGYDPEDCMEIALRRQMALGIESAYVKG